MQGVYFRTPETLAKIKASAVIRGQKRVGSHLTDEVREKMRQSKLGKKRTFTPEWIENLRKASIRAGCRPPSALGREVSEATRKKTSERMRGNKFWLGKLHSTETKSKIGRKKDEHWNWKGGVTPVHIQIRNTVEYKQWRRKVFERDNYTCQECGAKTYRGLGKRIILNADHIKPFSSFPELRFELSNGRTLCFDCHKKTDTYGGKHLY